MSESEAQLARKGRRLWGKFYSRKYRTRISSDGEKCSFPAPPGLNYPCSVATEAAGLQNKRNKAADEWQMEISGEGSLNIAVESIPFQCKPYCAGRNRARNHSGDTSLISELNAFHSSGSNAVKRSEFVDCVISNGEVPSESEACATLCSEKKQCIELAVDTGNVVDPSGHTRAREDSREYYHRERIVAESIATLCSENKLQNIKLEGVTEIVAAPLEQIGIRDDIDEHSHQENVVAGSIATLCSEKKLQQVQVVGHVANENVATPSDHIVVTDAASEYNDQFRMIAGSLVTLYSENSLQQIKLGCNTANVVASSELEDDIENVLAAPDHIAVRDDTADNAYEERIANESFATFCSENKKMVGLGDDITNAVSQSNHIAVRDDNAGYQDEERMVAESISTLYTGNKQQVELGGNSMNIIATLDLILVRNGATECNHQERSLAEEADASKPPHMRRLVDREPSRTILDQNSCVTETELDASVSDSVQCKVNGSSSPTMGLTDKGVVQDQAIRQEHAIQVQAIPLKSKPDKMQCQSTKLHFTSNACGMCSESSCLTTGQSTAQLECSKTYDNFSLQLLDNCHLNACQLADHDNQTKRTGPILRSRKIHFATSVVKKHQRRMMVSMSSEGGRSRNTFITKRLKKNAVKGLLEDYLKDWMDKNVRTGSFENEHCLPFLVHAPKRVVCYQCKVLVMPGKEVTCTFLNCRQSYHFACAKQLHGCHWFKKREFKCPQHVCMVCNCRQRLWHCVRCPVAVHRNCAPWPEAMVFLRDRPGPAICWRHHEDWRLDHKSWWIFFHGAAQGTDKQYKGGFSSAASSLFQ